jgi:hypothetical protein
MHRPQVSTASSLPRFSASVAFGWWPPGLRPQPNLQSRRLEAGGSCRAYVVDFFAETSRLLPALDRVTEVSLRCGYRDPRMRSARTGGCLP